MEAIFAKKDRLLEVARNKKELNKVITVMEQGLDRTFSWGRKASMWGLTFGLSCCAMEMMCMSFARWDADRYGLIFRASPRQADLLMVNGRVTRQMAPRIKRLYEQMAEPRYVIAAGECAINGGPFYDGYSIVDGVDKVIPVDIYIPGCPVTPEALFDGIIALEEKIQKYGKFDGTIKVPRSERRSYRSKTKKRS